MKHIEHAHILAQYTPETIIKALEPLILPPRLQRIDSVLANRLENIHLVFECPADVHNALAGVRSAEALGVVNIHIINPDNQALYTKTITQSSVYWINLHYYSSLTHFLSSLPSTGYTLAAAVMEGECTPEQLPLTGALYLMLGNENRGLSQAAIDAAQTTYRIPMVGMTESLNLSVTAAISMYQTTNARRELTGQAGDLSQGSYQALKAKYYLNSVSARYLKGVLETAGPGT